MPRSLASALALEPWRISCPLSGSCPAPQAQGREVLLALPQWVAWSLSSQAGQLPGLGRYDEHLGCPSSFELLVLVDDANYSHLALLVMGVLGQLAEPPLDKMPVAPVGC